MFKARLRDYLASGIAMAQRALERARGRVADKVPAPVSVVRIPIHQAQAEPKKRVKRIYPSREIVLGALSQEPQGVALVAQAIGFEQIATSEIVRGLVRDGQVIAGGKGRWTTYRLPKPEDDPSYGEDGASWS